MKFQGRYWLGYLSEEFLAGKPPDFLELYECVGEVDWALDPNIYEMQEEWRLGCTTVPRTCAFCGKTESDGATFNTTSHAIPENLGNKRIVSSEECDTCNSLYSDCEAHIAKMLSFERIFSGARGKSGPAGAESGPHLSIHGQGVGHPVILKVDSANSPIQYFEDTFEFSGNSVEFRPTLALRSLLRSAWLIIPPSNRILLEPVRKLAVGKNIAYPLDYVLVFSPGAPPTIGRLRVWCPRSDINRPESWPPLIVSLSLFNTTVVWRASVAGKRIPSPLPPLPIYDSTTSLTINSVQILRDEPIAVTQNWSMHYESKIMYSREASEERLVIPRVNPLSGLRKAKDIQLAISANPDSVDWIQACVQVKKLAGDFSGIALMIIRAPESGVSLQVRRLADGKMRLELNFNGVGLPIAQALKGIRFSIAFCNPPPDGKLLLAVDREVRQSVPLDGSQQSRETAEELVQIEQELLALQTISQVIDRVVVVPDSVHDINLIHLAAQALSNRCHISLKENVTVTICLTRSEYDIACSANRSITYPIGEANYPFAGVAALTKDAIGPVYLGVEVEHPAEQFPAAIIQQDASTVKVELKMERVIFIFERFVEQKKDLVEPDGKLS